MTTSGNLTNWPIEAFFSDGGYKVYGRNNGGTKCQPALPVPNPRPVPRVKGANANTCGATRSQSLATQGRQGRQLQPQSYTPRPGSVTTPAKLNQMQVEEPHTHDTIVFGHEKMMVCAVNQVSIGQVNCNSCNTVHTFYQCPSLAGMDEEAQKAFFHAKPLEKCNSKRNQCRVNQIRAD
jgi:hypothetical protein